MNYIFQVRILRVGSTYPSVAEVHLLCIGDVYHRINY